MLGGEVSYYVPNRMDEGYGLNREALETLRSRGAEMVITVDCGVASVDEAQAALELGLELIITDHHQLGPALPAAAAIVHPALPGSAYPFAGLCGAGVAFKLAWALCQPRQRRQESRPAHARFSACRRSAWSRWAPWPTSCRWSTKTASSCATGSPACASAPDSASPRWPSSPNSTTSRTCRARISPSRWPRDSTPPDAWDKPPSAVELLTTDSAERAAALAAYLNELNKSRESLERSIYLAANKQATERFDPANDAALVLADRGWHAGVIGIVAARLAEKFHRPVVLVSFDAVGAKPGMGSARSINGFDLHAALSANSEHLLSHGGHAAAAGLKIDESRIDAFREQFCEYAATEFSGTPRVAELRIDAEVPFSALTTAAVTDIERLAPFGQTNPRPLLCTTEVTLVWADQAHRRRRAPSVVAVGATRRRAAGRGLRRRRVGRRTGSNRRADRRGVSSLRESFSRSPFRRVAGRRLAARRGVGRRRATRCSARGPRFAMHAQTPFELERRTMLEQLSERGIRSTHVLAAMDRVPRERFVGQGVRHLSYADRALPIDCEQTISQPFIVAMMTEALQLSASQRVLEIGTGSGYQTAILAELAAEVVSIERHAELSQHAGRVLAELGYQNVTLVVGDGTQGWPELAPYDRILVAAAAGHVPQPLADQLAEGGILVIPVGTPSGQNLQAFHKSAGQLCPHFLSGCRFVPLVGAQDEEE